MLTLTAVALVAAVLFSMPVCAVPETSAASAILIDGDTGAVLYSLNADEPALIASTTKIMTAAVVLERCDLQKLVEIPPEAVGIEGSSIYLQPGEHLTVEALLYGLMLHSGNDAAVALALACSGSVQTFVELMNGKAAEWGLKDTSFANPNGLDSEDNHSTAADLAKMAMYALRNENFRKIVSTKNIVIGGRHLSNHNKLLWSMEGAIGVKTGYTKAAGRILVSAAEQKGRRLIAVTINDGNDWHDHKSLYDYGFAQYTATACVRKGEVVARLPGLDGGTRPLVAGEDFTWAMAQEEQLRIRIAFPKLSYGGETPGETAGWAELCLGERCIGTMPVLWGKERDFYERANTEDHCLPGPVLAAGCGAAPG
ncbi:MAG: D-alanyl-D-alanine carboxypeptidase [Oscillospiraceae bacterium]|nr:D-alanyl-D-alanine carboxypeptidase [Oscillospiraceae bacterium]